ncbi:MAG: hypothetical protein ACE5HT_08480 [Gemmatimonadales bacterium]
MTANSSIRWRARGLRTLTTTIAAAAAVAACDMEDSGSDLIFIDGRAVAAQGDSVLAMSLPGVSGILIRNRHTGEIDTLGANELNSPVHFQWVNDKWYISDVRDGRPVIVVLSAHGDVEGRIELDTVASAPHQFAVLEDGRIIVESRDSRLVALSEDSSTTFALVQASSRTGLLVAAHGGVLYAIPDRSITLYNALGRIRWRLDWPWTKSTFAADLAVDSQGRPHVIAGQQGRPGFVVFGLSPITGEVVRWSEEGPFATFVVDRMGNIEPDSASNWLGK